MSGAFHESSTFSSIDRAWRFTGISPPGSKGLSLSRSEQEIKNGRTSNRTKFFIFTIINDLPRYYKEKHRNNKLNYVNSNFNLLTKQLIKIFFVIFRGYSFIVRPIRKFWILHCLVFVYLRITGFCYHLWLSWMRLLCRIHRWKLICRSRIL